MQGVPWGGGLQRAVRTVPALWDRAGWGWLTGIQEKEHPVRLANRYNWQEEAKYEYIKNRLLTGMAPLQAIELTLLLLHP